MVIWFAASGLASQHAPLLATLVGEKFVGAVDPALDCALSLLDRMADAKLFSVAAAEDLMPPLIQVCFLFCQLYCLLVVCVTTTLRSGPLCGSAGVQGQRQGQGRRLHADAGRDRSRGTVSSFIVFALRLHVLRVC